MWDCNRYMSRNWGWLLIVWGFIALCSERVALFLYKHSLWCCDVNYIRSKYLYNLHRFVSTVACLIKIRKVVSCMEMLWFVVGVPYWKMGVASWFLTGMWLLNQFIVGHYCYVIKHYVHTISFLCRMFAQNCRNIVALNLSGCTRITDL